MAGDLADSVIGLLVGPDRVFEGFAADRDAEVVGVTLVGAVGDVRGAGQQRHVGVGAGDILHGRVARLLQGQGMAGGGNLGARGGDTDVLGV